MKPVTVRSDPLSVDLQSNGSVRIARTDRGESVELSQTEWQWLVSVSQLFGWGHSPMPVQSIVDPQ